MPTDFSKEINDHPDCTADRENQNSENSTTLPHLEIYDPNLEPSDSEEEFLGGKNPNKGKSLNRPKNVPVNGRKEKQIDMKY